ncbi:MAG TPA: hypothetical protein PLQ76_08650, partial [bacterium]|nr:hypothetical protein [bacterium]
MKKLLGFFIAIFVMSIALPVFAAEDIPVHMNVRFWNRDDKTQEARWSLHAVEITAAKEEQNIGGLVTYRIADQLGVNGLNANSTSFPVEAKVYIKGGAHKLTTGLMFVPFAIYKWNNLYIPTLDVPGKRGHIWDADWGMLYTYDAKPILLDIGYFDNAGEKMSNEQTEKNTITARLGYDAFSNWNIGASFL